jgi:hypothetical protein
LVVEVLVDRKEGMMMDTAGVEQELIKQEQHQ